MNNRKIKNIIFDLGGVLLNIDFNLMNKAFAELGVTDFANVYAKHKQDKLFDDLEVGKITPTEFCQGLRTLCNIQSDIDDKQICNAWNKILLDFPEERLQLLARLKQQGYKLFLFSNTNQIHYEAFTSHFRQVFPEKTLESYFEEAHFSFIDQMRKPSPDAFRAILNKHHLQAAETLFIDDTACHIEGAKAAGLEAKLLELPEAITDICAGVSRVEHYLKLPLEVS